MKNKTLLFMFFCWLICSKLLAQPYTINRTGTAPVGTTTLILADIINSDEQISGSDNISYRGTQSIHLTDGFSASGLTAGGLFHTYIQPLQIAYISVDNTGAESEISYALTSSQISAIPQFSRFEIGIQIPADVQTQITNFLVDAYSTIQPNDVNPYDRNQIQIEVDFSNGTNTYTRYGFYYSDFTEINTSATTTSLVSSGSASPWHKNSVQYPFRVRFAPPTTGAWNFTVKLFLGGIFSSNITASYMGGAFNVSPSTNPGFLKLDPILNKMRFQASNALFYGIGENIPFAGDASYYGADPYDYIQQRTTIADLKNKGGNFVRIRLDPWSNAVESQDFSLYSDDPPSPVPLNNCVTNYDHNQRHMWEFDQTLALCESENVYIMLNLLQDQYFSTATGYGAKYIWGSNPYSTLPNGADSGMSPATGGIYNFFSSPTVIAAYQKTLFYMNARWGYSPNIALWEHINETDNLGFTNTNTDPITHYYQDPAGNGTYPTNAFANAVDLWICTMKNYMNTIDPNYNDGTIGFPNHLQTCGYGFFTWQAVISYTNRITCLDVFAGNDYSGSISNNIFKYANHPNNHPWSYVTGSLMNTKPFLLGENGVGCGGVNYNGVVDSVDSDAPDNNSDIEFHKNLWSSAFSGSITTALWWTDWFQTVQNTTSSSAAAAQHRSLNFPALNTFLNANVNFDQVLYPQNEYPTGTIGLNYGGTQWDFLGDTLKKHVDNFFLLNAQPPVSGNLPTATLGYGYCYNRSYFWQTDPAISTYAPNYMCSSTDGFHVDPNDAYGINGTPPPNNTDPPLHFYNLQPSTTFSLTYFETAGATQVGSATATSDINGNLDFYLPFGAGTNIDATHPPDYAYVLSQTCIGCLRTANASNSHTSSTSNISAIQNQTKLGTNIKLGIFPNPTSGVVYLNLSAQNAGALLVNITDVNGNQLLHNRFAANEGANSFKLDLSNLNSGVYFINITDENGVPIKNDKLVLMGQ